MIVLAPVVTYPNAHLNAHVGLLDAAPPEHEAPAVVVAAVALMAGRIGPGSGVGSTVGKGDGLCVGSGVGSGVDSAVGKVEGLNVGSLVGWKVGWRASSSFFAISDREAHSSRIRSHSGKSPRRAGPDDEQRRKKKALDARLHGMWECLTVPYPCGRRTLSLAGPNRAHSLSKLQS